MEMRGSFNVIGIALETSNEHQQASKDIGELWGRFYSENIAAQVPNPIGEEVYAIYTDYESNYKGKYTIILGLQVHSLDNIPDGLIGRLINGGYYKHYEAKGNMPDAVVNTWLTIWQEDAQLSRSYIADYEIYGDQAQQGVNSVVDIYLGTR